MAKLVKIERAGTVLFVEEKKLDFYLEHGYKVLQSDKAPAHLKPPLFPEPKEARPVQPFEVPAELEVKPEDQAIAKPIKAEKPKRKSTRKKKADK